MFDIKLFMIKASTSWSLCGGGVIIFWEKKYFRSDFQKKNRSEMSKKNCEAYVDIVLNASGTGLEKQKRSIPLPAGYRSNYAIYLLRI